MLRSDTTARLSFTLIFLYLFSFGATFSGILFPPLKFVTLGLMALVAGVWFLLHITQRWTGFNTPLDSALILWGLAFGLSLLANMDAGRRIVMGLWSVGVYVGVWYLLADMIANRAVKRGILIEASLFAGLIILFFGYFQLFSAPSLAQLPRPGSVVGNPNSLGSMLVVLGALAIGRAVTVSGTLGKWIFGLYAVAVLILLLMTFSRGAWIGMIAAVFALIGLTLIARGAFRRDRARALWRELLKRTRRVFQLSALGGMILAMIAGVLFVGSLNASGRSLSLRFNIYGDALALIREKPVTGHGLFSFGREFLRYESEPPLQPHSHAHNGILQIGVELGLVGWIAFGVTLVLMLLSFNRNLQTASERERAVMIPAGAALFGWGVHQLFDFPAMMPLIALTGLILLGVAVIPLQAQPITARWRVRGHLVGLTALWAVLILSGLWSASLYQRYNAILMRPFGADGDGDYLSAADDLQSIVDADPYMAIYADQQAYLYALGGDYTRAAERYERVVELEPDNAVGWANLARVYHGMGRMDDAISAMETAVDRAPQSPQLRFNLGMLYEENGDVELARAMYESALNQESRLWLAWDETPLRREIAESFEPHGETALVLAVAQNQVADEMVSLDESTASHVIRVWAMLRDTHEDSGRYMAAAIESAVTDEDWAWVALGHARFDYEGGRLDEMQAELDKVWAFLEADFNVDETVYGTNIPYYQLLRFAIPRRFLPGVTYPRQGVDPALAYLARALEEKTERP